MATVTSSKDADLVVTAARDVLNRYGTDSNLADLLRGGDTTTVLASSANIIFESLLQ